MCSACRIYWYTMVISLFFLLCTLLDGYLPPSFVLYLEFLKDSTGRKAHEQLLLSITVLLASFLDIFPRYNLP